MNLPPSAFVLGASLLFEEAPDCTSVGTIVAIDEVRQEVIMKTLLLTGEVASFRIPFSAIRFTVTDLSAMERLK